jgi:mRNA-degrading endonuclease toxin of MazEF toxin-antitoxin module
VRGEGRFVGRFEFGEIVFTEISDGHGNAKPRPALVISSDESNDQGDDLQVLAISTTPDHTYTHYHIEIPQSPSHKLCAGSRVKCNWAREVRQVRVIRSLGVLDDDLMTIIIDCFDQLYNDTSFTDWQ